MTHLDSNNATAIDDGPNTFGKSPQKGCELALRVAAKLADSAQSMAKVPDAGKPDN
jgi:hypothetical protein